MPHRYPILEKIAFTLFTLSAVVDATYISYEKSPNFRDNIHEIIRIGEEMSRLYPADVDPWMQIAIS